MTPSLPQVLLFVGALVGWLLVVGGVLSAIASACLFMLASEVGGEGGTFAIVLGYLGSGVALLGTPAGILLLLLVRRWRSWRAAQASAPRHPTEGARAR